MPKDFKEKDERNESKAAHEIRRIEGGVTAPVGFLAAGVHCGIKAGVSRKKDDLALIVSEPPCTAAATFTTNRVKAAPVKVSQEHLRTGSVSAILANSGNANACTGIDGIRHAQRMAEVAGAHLGIKPRGVMVCSTGRIGVPLPIAVVEEGIPRVVQRLSRGGSRQAAKAIMTSDTKVKEVAVEIEIEGRPVRIGGIAKGAGMIDPNMATMLAFFTTDAAVDKRDLRKALGDAVETSFNRITVDGDMSTNDTAILLANGRSGTSPLKNGEPGLELFRRALAYVALVLAKMIVKDGECASRYVELTVQGAKTFQDARKAARAVANSILVKCAIHGADPNWGRILDALGYSSARIREEMIDVYFNGQVAVKNGVASGMPKERLAHALKRRKSTILVDLHLGEAAYTIYTTDLSPGFVKYNMSE